MKLLVIDDEEEILNMLKRKLSVEGYEVVTVTEPHKAIDLMKTELFNLVLCDIKMPGMNGVDLLKILKQINPLAIIIMMTGYSSMSYVVDCLGSGAMDYFVKPFEDLETIRKVLDEARYRIKRWQDVLRLRSVHGTNMAFGTSGP
ncbi:MAG: response regulator [Deltaproteobacteria bacterium]|nr:response regulator [Deltaproteobacteria bacterium]